MTVRRRSQINAANCNISLPHTFIKYLSCFNGGHCCHDQCSLVNGSMSSAGDLCSDSDSWLLSQHAKMLLILKSINFNNWLYLTDSLWPSKAWLFFSIITYFSVWELTELELKSIMVTSAFIPFCGLKYAYRGIRYHLSRSIIHFLIKNNASAKQAIYVESQIMIFNYYINLNIPTLYLRTINTLAVVM